MKPTNKRQTEHHQKMLDQGYKKRSFYVTEDTLKALNEYKEKHDLKNINDALNQILAP